MTWRKLISWTLTATQPIVLLSLIPVAVFAAVFDGVKRNREFRSRWKSLCWSMAESSTAIGDGFNWFWRQIGGFKP